VTQVAATNRPLADRKDQKLKVSAPKPVTAVGDHDRLAEAVDNLVSNAIKYSPKGAEIEVKVAATKNSASIRITDQGPGLTREDMSRLFGRFQRLSAQPTAGESSTGLGLSIAKRIVELHGGTIEAASEGGGKGATFEILLPTERWVEP
jgi:signal transduction histidine kinase